jgi:hypothetical protein
MRAFVYQHAAGQPQSISFIPVTRMNPRANVLASCLALLAFACMLASPSAFALRCGTRIVTEGTQDFQVRDRCGDPFYADTYYATEVFGALGPVAQFREVQYDVWYYNFGPRALMRRFVFRDGVLLREETLGYGVDEIGDDCNPNRDYRGVSVGELMARCGEPATRRTNYDTLVRQPNPGYARYRDQRREEWIYDFGENRFLRLFRLIDGRVDDIETVER